MAYNITRNSTGSIYFVSYLQNTLFKVNTTDNNCYFIEQIEGNFIEQNTYYHTFDTNGKLWFFKNNTTQTNIYSLSNENNTSHSYPVFANLDTNNVRAMYWCWGSMFWDLQGEAKYEVPKNSGKTSLFANAIWIGGFDENNQLHLAGEKFRQNGEDYFAGPIMDSVYYSQEQSKWKTLWKINRDDIIYHAIHFNDAGYIMPQSISSWPGNGDTTKGQQFNLAPYKDVNNNLIYDPQNGDFPIISGDQAIFFILNDAQSNHTETGGKKLGIEIHAMAYAFNIPTSDAFYNTTFLKLKIFNRSTTNYHDLYIGNWDDTDLGSAVDDYIGCDVQRSSYIVYNGKSIDGTGEPNAYGVNPPAQSITFLGLTMPADGIDNPANIDFGINGYGFGDNIIDNEKYGMTRFMYFNNGGCNDVCDPNTADQHYYYLSGYWKDGIPLTYGSTGHDLTNTNTQCKFMFPGNSDPLHWGTNYQIPAQNPNNWNEETMNNPYGDRRGVGSSGPITLLAGQSIDMDLAFVWGWDTTQQGGPFDQLLSNIDTIRSYFSQGITPTGQQFETYSPIIKENLETITLYPNPTSNVLTVETNLTEKTIYTIYDCYGKTIKTGTLHNHRTSIDVSGFSKGVYILVLNNNKTITKKFIRN